ncbi:MAG: hypothetical protein H6558_03335 [Lewinellaceae bacterium]|nr:hypothetical protein [Lewinellaceae bacterium]MCB9289886.1 hypothetical protein [Lewinellaceae bacterium]
MRISIPALLLGALLLWSCAGGGNPGDKGLAEAKDSTVVAPEAEPVAPAEPEQKTTGAFEKSLAQGPVSFNLYSPNVPEGNTLVVSPSGLEIRNDTFRMEVSGLVHDARLADLDKDGFPEVYAFARSTGADSTAFVYAFSSYRNRSYGAVGVRELSSRPEMARGFKGHSTFYFEDGRLKRSFPVYEQGEPTGKKRVVTYALRQGEASFILEPVSSVEMDGN